MRSVMRSSPISRQNKGAFSLVEMLTAIAVLSLIVIGLGQILNMTTATWKRGQQESNNLEKARIMMDLFSRDLQCAILRNDLAAFPSGQIAFYTQRPGVANGSSGDSRDVSLVMYQMNNSNILQRFDFPTAWSSSPDVISFGNTSTLPKLTAAKSRDTVSGIVDYKVVFLYSDGTFNIIYDVTKTKLLRAVALTIAVIDDQTLLQLDKSQQTASKMGMLQTALDNVSLGASSSYKAAWENYLSTMDWTPYPKGFGSGLRIFERYVTVTAPYVP